MRFFDLNAPSHAHQNGSQHQHVLLFGYDGEWLTLVHIDGHDFLHVPCAQGGQALLTTNQKIPISYVSASFPATKGQQILLIKPCGGEISSESISLGEMRGHVSLDDQRVVEYLSSSAVVAVE